MCVCVLLGCDYPLLLNPTGPGGYLVVGQMLVYGLMDGESILGPLPTGWRIQMLPGSDGRQVTCFFNNATGKITRQDPRLPPLPSEWEKVHRSCTQDDRYFYQDFYNRITGETIISDPRVSVSTLSNRGVGTEKFRLV